MKKQVWREVHPSLAPNLEAGADVIVTLKGMIDSSGDFVFTLGQTTRVINSFLLGKVDTVKRLTTYEEANDVDIEI